jgi:ParB family transcriptional regulator, chromosome partitioning protein
LLGVATRLNRYVNSISAFDNVEVGLISYSSNPLRGLDQDVEELVESIREHGLLEPIIIRPKGKRFEVLAGNRRLRACRILKHRKVKCIVTDLDDAQAFEVSLVENVQRRTLSPIEEAIAFRNYCDKFGWGSQTDLAKKIGKSQEYVSHRMKLLDLPTPALDALKEGRISPSGAEELVWIKDEGSRNAALKLLESDAFTTKSVRTLSQPHEHVAEKDGENPDFYRERDRGDERSSKLLTESILILRISLVRLDGIIAKARDPGLKKILLSKRYALHTLVDELTRVRSGSDSPLYQAAQIQR